MSFITPVSLSNSCLCLQSVLKCDHFLKIYLDILLKPFDESTSDIRRTMAPAICVAFICNVTLLMCHCSPESRIKKTETHIKRQELNCGNNHFSEYQCPPVSDDQLMT